jgi:hypothetical protein
MNVKKITKGAINSNPKPKQAAPKTPDIDFIWEEYQKQAAAEAEAEANSISIYPTPGFVVKAFAENPEDKNGVFDSFMCASVNIVFNYRIPRRYLSIFVTTLQLNRQILFPVRCEHFISLH